VRLCAGCVKKARALTCGRCGKLRPTARRNDGGQPLCQNCWHQDPRGWKPCARCGNNRRVAAITPHGPVCQSCRPGPELACAICGATDSRIGISRATGAPTCDRCRKRWIICTGAPLKGGTPLQPLCARCVNPDPAFWKRCAVCQTTWQLSTAECTHCALERKLTEVFAPADGALVAELDRLRSALIRTDRPDSVLTWLTRARVRTLLHELAHGQRALTHQALDALPTSHALTHLRSMLVASGALPARDERLTALERWIDTAVAARAVADHRRALHGYAVWHHLRRLRGRLDGQPVSYQQDSNIRDHVAAATALLDWLEARELTLGTCSQAEFDQWLCQAAGHRTRSTNFVRWALSHRHASGLTATATRWTGPSGPLDHDRRWADARRLLREQRYPPADRVAGLLVLLYAQKLSDITALTLQHVRRQDGQALLYLGSRPIVLPPPLDTLIDELIATRRNPAGALLATNTPWLFPGRWPGGALSEDALARRLRALDINPRQSRNTALFTLAAEIPAVILAKTLGIHIKAAIHWQKISAGDWSAYAADISRRNQGRTPIGSLGTASPPARPTPDTSQAGSRTHGSATAAQ
jgi:hypothetical protein